MDGWLGREIEFSQGTTLTGALPEDANRFITASRPDLILVWAMPLVSGYLVTGLKMSWEK